MSRTPISGTGWVPSLLPGAAKGSQKKCALGSGATAHPSLESLTGFSTLNREEAVWPPGGALPQRQPPSPLLPPPPEGKAQGYFLMGAVFGDCLDSHSSKILTAKAEGE